MVDTRDSKSRAERRGGSSPLQGRAAALSGACLSPFIISSTLASQMAWTKRGNGDESIRIHLC